MEEEEERKRKEKKRKEKEEKKKSVRGKPKGKKKRAFDFLCYDGWKSIGRELKLLYSTRATSRCQKKQEVRHHVPRSRSFFLYWFLFI